MSNKKDEVVVGKGRTITGEDDNCVILAGSDQIYSRKNAKSGFREDFYNELDLEHGFLKHHIVVGDICAIKTSSSSNSEGQVMSISTKEKFPPFEEQKWIIGQVLALYRVKKSINASSWMATIRWMARFGKSGKEAKTYIESEEELQSFIKGTNDSSGKVIKPPVDFRPKQALLETLDILVVPVSDILPADIWVVHSKAFIDKDELKHKDIDIPLPRDISNLNPAYKVSVHCVARCSDTIITNNNSGTSRHRQLHDVREEWALYREHRLSMDASSAGPPPPLQRGWDLLQHDPELQQILRQTYKCRSRDVFSLTVAAEAAVAAAAASTASVTSSHYSKMPSLSSTNNINSKKRALSTKTNNNNSTISQKSKSTKANNTLKKTKAPPPPAKKDVSKKVAKNRKDLESKSSNSSERKKATTKSIVVEMTLKKKGPNEMRDDSQDDDSDNDNDDDSEEVESLSLNPVPIGNVIHELQLPCAGTRKNKKSKTAPPPILIATTTKFYQGIELNVEPETLHADFRGDAAQQRWNFGVGDVIAIRCEDAARPSKGPLPKKSVWYPFIVPWCPVQVVAIYYNNDVDNKDDDEGDCSYRMQVRWMTRPAELPATVKKNLESETKKILQGDNAAHMIIEDDDSEAQEVSVEAALGHVVTTSNHKPSSTWLKTFLSLGNKKKKKKLPQVPLICCYRYANNKDDPQLQRIDDWTNYGQSLDEGPMARALALGMPGKHKKLRQAYEAVILGGGKKPPLSTKAASRHKRKPTVDSSKTSTASRKRSKKEEESSQESHSPDCDMDLSDTTFANMDRNTTPIGDVVYEMPATQRKEPIQFVEGVEMDVDPLAFHPDVRAADASGSIRRFRFRVGDLVALSDDTAKTRHGLGKNKPTWYPFVKPWSAAQVLAIYRQGNTNSTASHQGYQMQVRWFSRPEELLPSVVAHLTTTAKQELIRSKNAAHMVVELDECVYEKCVESTIGHVVTSSELNPPSSWLQSFLSRKRLPQAPLICRYLQNTKDDDPELDRVDDWTDYGTTLVGPLSRGLLCPKAMPGKDKNLRKLYEFCVRHRYKLTDKSLQEFASDGPLVEASTPPEAAVRWTQSQLDGVSIEVNEQDFLEHSRTGKFGNKYKFLHSIVVPVVRNRCDARVTSKKSNDRSFTVEIGDIVCVANNEAGTPTVVAAKKKANAWYPFVAGWCYYQVLSIYQINGGAPRLELRRFLRKTELPKDVQSWLPPTNNQEEEVYESDVVVTDIPASRVLGHVSIFLAKFTESCDARTRGTVHDGAPPDAPNVSCRCRYFYLSSFKRIQPLFCSEMSPSKWFQQLMERGFKQSDPAKKNELLRSSIEAYRDIHLDASRDLIGGLMDSVKDESPAPKKAFSKKLENGCLRSYFISAAIQPNWSTYVQSDTICPASDRAGKLWTVRIGDVVALHTPKSNNLAMYPFNVPWKPCQILSIYCDESDSTDRPESGRGCLSLEVKWLSFCEEKDVSIMSSVYETKGDTDCTDPLDTSMLLGPLLLHCRASAAKMWGNVLPFLPLCPLLYTSLPEESNNPDRLHRMLHSFVTSGISSHYSNEHKNVVLKALAQDVEADNDICLQPIQKYALQAFASESNINSFGSAESIATSSASTSVSAKHVSVSEPFHTDLSTGTTYFRELQILPSPDAYAKPPHPQCNSSPTKKPWTVKLGDPVALKHKMCLGPATFSSGSDITATNKNFPFEIPWAVGEVVMIHNKSTSSSTDSVKDDCEQKVEVRWFYRSGEIPGSMDEASNEDCCEEIMESDHYDTVSATSLLAPIILHDHPRDIPEETWYLGMPVINFVCRRFWSCHRRSLVPCAGLASRISRGRLQSNLIGKNSALASALEKISSCEANPQFQTTRQTPVDWRTAFEQVIHKLSLTDASKVAYEDASALVGRENEKAEIESFLRTAITGRGEQGTKEDRASMFIAGAPGVGKTACVRAVVRELKEQQAMGSIPEFDFILLNGMEMRYPFEAYAQLWEKLHVGDKTQCSPEQAVKKLETYFTSQASSETKRTREGKKEHVVVLLLDEIDYLLTKTQSVLYHFFDWPRRASHNRLIVIGVSNTVNLPERLQSKVQSRIGSCRCSFKAYNSKEIVAILESKIKQASPHQKVFDHDAILFVSKKTATMSGDIRKAFNICRSAAELVMTETTSAASDNESQLSLLTSNKGPIVRIKDVSRVSRESFNSPQSHAVSMCTPYEALLLLSLASLSKTTGREVGGFDVEELLVKMESIANSSGDRQYLPAPSLSETLSILARLGEAQLVSMVTPRGSSIGYRSCIAGSGGPWPVVSLMIDNVALLLALKSTPHKDCAEKHLSI